MSSIPGRVPERCRIVVNRFGGVPPARLDAASGRRPCGRIQSGTDGCAGWLGRQRVWRWGDVQMGRQFSDRWQASRVGDANSQSIRCDGFETMDPLVTDRRGGRNLLPLSSDPRIHGVPA